MSDESSAPNAVASDQPWYTINNADQLPTPCLVVYPDRITRNIDAMLTVVGSDPARLCPHVKTHKMARVLDLYAAAGVDQFKAATTAELQMVASSGARFGLLAYQPVGPHVEELLDLVRRYPQTCLATVVDSPRIVDRLAAAAAHQQVKLEVLLDLDVGMGRTGIRPGPAAEQLYRQIVDASSLVPGGLHVYDGHIHDSDPTARSERIQADFAQALTFRQDLLAAGHAVPRLLAGGTPSFPEHARHADRICSPGTPVFWDRGYQRSFPDLQFHHAALVLTRVVSRLGGGQYCLDLGHKSVAADQPQPRADLINVPDAELQGHSEEHLVIHTTADLQVGDLVYAVPQHICPTVALHDEAWAVHDRIADQRWPVTARGRGLRDS